MGKCPCELCSFSHVKRKKKWPRESEAEEEEAVNRDANDSSFLRTMASTARNPHNANLSIEGSEHGDAFNAQCWSQMSALNAKAFQYTSSLRSIQCSMHQMPVTTGCATHQNPNSAAAKEHKASHKSEV